MKAKLDFVTNSSSSCFCIWGKSFEINDLRKNTEFVDKIFNSLGDVKESMSPDEYFCEIEDICDYFIIKGLDTIDMEDGYMAVGLVPDNLPEAQTLGEIKKTIQTVLEEAGLDSEIGWINEVVYN